jgi:hypothetical protein
MPTCFLYIYFPSAGRGVDLNRNWSVDWGKKEKVSISVFTGKIKYASSLAC